jgi:hypothetical protein
MFLVLRRVVGIDQDVINIDNDANIKHIAENVIHEMLKNSWTVGKTERHDLPLKRTVSGLKGGLPFVTFRDSD